MTVTFHNDVILDSSDFTLRCIGGGEYPLAATYKADTMTATVTSQLPLVGGHYELVVADSIVDAENGLALDGELSTPLKTAAEPSGDGSPGGDAVIALAAIGTRSR